VVLTVVVYSEDLESYEELRLVELVDILHVFIVDVLVMVVVGSVLHLVYHFDFFSVILIAHLSLIGFFLIKPQFPKTPIQTIHLSMEGDFILVEVSHVLFKVQC
jgi:hypothetical protein